MDQRQRTNGRAILAAVSEYGREQGWDAAMTRRAARLSIMCAMTESNLWVYANRNNPESLALPHDQVGSDHASVGLFQQQVPGWGTTADCMDVRLSTRKFLRALGTHRQLPPYKGRPLWERVQDVQVSAFPTGNNYRRNRARSWLFLVHWWDFKRAAPR